MGKWRRRFAEHGLDGLDDEPRPGTPRKIGDDDIAETIRKTLEETPAAAARWSLRSMAKATGDAPSTTHRIWQAFGLQPHRSETLKLSADPLKAKLPHPSVVEKVRNIVGLYLDPPERALVLRVDEREGREAPNQRQTLDRTQPLPPIRPGQAERRTHDYTRPGATSLFAERYGSAAFSLDIAAGKVIGRCFKQRRAKEFLKFLREIDANVPEDLDVHLVMDNDASHKTPAIRTWLAKRPH